MAKFTGKSNFANGDAVTAAALNEITTTLLLGQDSFVTSSFTVNAGVVSVTAGGIVRADLQDTSDENTGINAAKITDGAIITAKLPDSTSTTTGVTYAKMQFVENTDNVGRVLGRITNADGVVEELKLDSALSVVSASHDTVPTAKAVKDYVDSAPNFVPTTVDGTTDYVKFPNGLIHKMGTVSAASAESTTILFDSTLAFTTIYSIQVTAEQDTTALAASVKTIASDKTTFDASHANGVTNLHYLAIGR